MFVSKQAEMTSTLIMGFNEQCIGCHSSTQMRVSHTETEFSLTQKQGTHFWKFILNKLTVIQILH